MRKKRRKRSIIISYSKFLLRFSFQNRISATIEHDALVERAVVERAIEEEKDKNHGNRELTPSWRFHRSGSAPF